MTSSPTASMPVQQRAWETRTRILDGAVEALVELGYAGASTSAVLARAGVSRGSLLHQFRSKDELLVAAVQHLAEARTRALATTPPPRTPDGALDVDRAVETLWATLRGPLFTATVELWVAARTNPALRDVLRPEEHRLGALIRESFGAVFGPDHAATPRFRSLCSLLWSSMRGVALTYTFDPRDPSRDPHLDEWKQLVRDHLDSSDMSPPRSSPVEGRSGHSARP